MIRDLGSDRTPRCRPPRPVRRDAAALSLWILGLAALACAGGPTIPPPSAGFEPYRVGAPDQLIVTVLPDPLIQEAVIVRPDGMITIQLVGDVSAAGRTLHEIGSDIEERIAQFKRGARATVALAAAQSSTVTVLGEVRTPGTFALTKQTRIAEALGNRGGTTQFAKQSKIRVVRSSLGQPTVFEVDMSDILVGDMSTNIELKGGDVVYVPPTAWARVGYAVNAALFPFSPIMRFLTSVGSSYVGAALVP